MKSGIDLTIDFAFKWSFGTEDHLGYLKSFLEHTLHGRLNGPIRSLRILTPILDRDAPDTKLSILDLLVQDESGTIYHVEVQIVGNRELPKRFLYYWSRAYINQLQAGMDYLDLPRVISIVLVDSVMFAELPYFHNCFQITERTQGTVFCEDFELHLIELPKFQKTEKELADGFDQWVYLMKHSAELDPESPPADFTVPEVIGVLKGLEMMSQIQRERMLYEGRLKAHFDEVSRQNWSRRQREDGLKEGREEGRKEVQMEFLRKTQLIEQIVANELSKGNSIPSFSDLINHSEDELKRMSNSLE